MAKDSILVAETRAGCGTSAARRLRRAGWMPAVLTTQERAVRSIQLKQHAFELLLRRHASENMIVDLAVDGGDAKKALITDVQHDPLNDAPVHADFTEISMTKVMTFSVAVRLVGEPVGVTQEGGLLEHMLRELEIECLPTDLPDRIDVDVTHVHVEHSLLVRDVVLDPKLKIKTAGDQAIAAVLTPKMEEEKPAEAEAAEAATSAEPEVITAKKEEGEGEEGAEKGKEKAAPKKGEEKAKEKK